MDPTGRQTRPSRVAQGPQPRLLHLMVVVRVVLTGALALTVLGAPYTGQNLGCLCSQKGRPTSGEEYLLCRTFFGTILVRKLLLVFGVTSLFTFWLISISETLKIRIDS